MYIYTSVLASYKNSRSYGTSTSHTDILYIVYIWQTFVCSFTFCSDASHLSAAYITDLYIFYATGGGRGAKMSAKCQLMTSDTSFRNVCKMVAKNLCDINRGEMLSLVHGVLGNNN